jgi:hypothetical protein
MQPLSASELLTVWEQGVGRHPVEQALLVLAACGGEAPEELAALPLGERDARLFAVYKQLFGPDLEAFGECADCGERLEYSVDAREFRQSTPAAEGTELVSGDRVLHVRRLNSTDLLEVREAATDNEARRRLAERAVDTPGLSEAEVDAVSVRLAEADPQAELLIALHCPACRSANQVVLAIDQFLWTKIAWLAKRLLREVHVLASAYGWSEREILSLSAVRRRRYLEWAEA